MKRKIRPEYRYKYKSQSNNRTSGETIKRICQSKIAFNSNKTLYLYQGTLV